MTKTHSRPHVSDDNPFSESQFKTLKYRPEFPDRFGSLYHTRSFCQEFFPWYNTEHHHSGLGLLTPAVVHYQRAEEVRHLRQQTLDAAYAAHPERFVRKPPQPPARGMRGVPAFETSTPLMLEPAMNPVWAWLVHGAWSLAGGAVILLATLANTWRHSRTNARAT